MVIGGHPRYYVAQGFLSCRNANVCAGDGIFPSALWAEPPVDGAFDGRRQRYSESEAYNFDAKGAEEYDKLFEYKEKKYLPSQEEFYIYSNARIPG